MAAGSVDVWRRRDSTSHYSKKESYGSRNVVQKKCSWGHRHSKSRSIPSGGHDPAILQKEASIFLSDRQTDGVRVLHDSKSYKTGGGDQHFSAKKRRFSPIIWDINEKDAKRCKMESSTSNVSCASPSRTFEGASDTLSDAVPESFVSFNGKKEETLIHSPEFLDCTTASHSLLSQQQHDTIREQLQVQVGDFIQTVKMPTSRWEADSDGEEEGSKNSSPESGEFVRKHSGGSCMQSGSNERSCSRSSVEDRGRGSELGNDHASEWHGNDAYVERLDSDSDEVSERQMDMLKGCRSLDEYEILNKISEGTYGVVYKARDMKTGEFVALKKLKDLDRRNMEDYGFPVSYLREINILGSFCHPSIVNVKEVVLGKNDVNVFMVMEYVEHDLKELMAKMRQPFSISEVKCLMLQLLEGIKYLHDHWVLHRDLKPSNLLLNNKGDLKICDFGMARHYGSPLKPYTTKVVTQMYRAPELLYGAKKYSTAVDMWSVGCIMAEFLAKEPIFKGTSEIDQIRKICDILGVPTDKSWPGLAGLPGSKACIASQPNNLLRKRFPAASFTGSPILTEMGFDLLNRLLTYDPDQRLTADEAINHGWFHEVPLPKSREFMPTFPQKHL